MTASGQLTIERRLELLRSVALFADVEESLLLGIAANLEIVSIAAGEWLFHRGDVAAAAYVLASGRVEVVNEAGRVVSTLRRGAALGELALLRGEVRAASVRARRDSTLIALSPDQFETLLRDSPGFGLTLTRRIADQLVISTAAIARESPARALAIVALDGLVDAVAAANALREELQRTGRVTIIDRPVAARSQEWAAQLGRAEAASDHVVLVAQGREPDRTWMSFCVREADLVIALAGRSTEPAGWADGSLRGCELVCVDTRPGDGLIERLQPRQVRAVKRTEGLVGAMHHLARCTAGRSVGLVLSGGGARAFAHLGVIEGLRDAGITIDRIGGVSLGALVAAFVARGDAPEYVYELMHRHMVKRNPTNDYTLPIASVIRGRKTARLLAGAFADARIEDLPIPFFCTSTDLLRREIVVHRSGPVSDALLASLSIPCVFPPVRDHHGRLLVDGGVLDNLPVRTMHESAGGPVIAVDVTATTGASSATATSRPRLRPAREAVRRLITGNGSPLPSLPETIVRCITLASADTVDIARRHAALVISPSVSGIGMLDWQRLPEMRAAGIDAARQALAEAGESANVLRDCSAVANRLTRSASGGPW